MAAMGVSTVICAESEEAGNALQTSMSQPAPDWERLRDQLEQRQVEARAQCLRVTNTAELEWLAGRISMLGEIVSLMSTTGRDIAR